MTNRVTETAERATSAASEKLGTAYSATKEKTGATLDSARARLSSAAERTASGIDSNPVAAVIGGLAVGAITGALLPRTTKEKALLGPVGTRVNETARAAAAAARSEGEKKLDELGINRATAQEQARKLFSTLSEAAGTAGSAALHAARESRTAR
ncbi:hypothetical protein CLG96_13880 [Sphingomonas oleivorans]|uniref:DUF883 domain-containing protein n=1 Tax=Sphingomonas oleivorans TaxID=1735121 RepID=A0A2T5FWN3_9SPHN|nr:hypothetical protein [Sphingomonas oleivorans]PTQ10200.1 hypothetical protein CLG96_13880 [Sphingomonas oleivorans]